MLISSQLFDRIVGTSAHGEDVSRKAAVLPVGCRRAAERRAATRIAFGQRTPICRDGGKKAGVWDVVMMQDISVKGIGFLCHDPMNIGDTFVMKVADKGDDQPIRIRCSIQRCERGGYGGAGYLLGAVFEQVIQHQPLHLNDDDEDTHDAAHDAQPLCDVPIAQAQPTNLRKAAFSFLKSLDPSNWLRKADDYSSV